MKESLYRQIQMELKEVKLIVVSKYRTVEQLMEYYDLGQRDFAENRVQELLIKKEQLPKDIRWHMIGHLQSNKVKAIVPFIQMIHSVDSIALMETIDKEAKKALRRIPVCIQFNLAKEITKSGFPYEAWEEVMEYARTLSSIHVVGIMVMGPHTENQEEIASVFHEAQDLLKRIQEKYPEVCELSMGMSADYREALKYGTTMVRLGSILF